MWYKAIIIISFGLIGLVTRTYGDDECTSPKIKWTGCPRTRSCDACFSIEFDDAKKGSDIMCMNKSPNTECIWTGNLINDSSFVAVTGSNGKCRPFGNDPLEVSLSSDRCSGSWLVDENGVGKRPPCVFCNGATDIAVEPPSERLPPPEIATENPGQAPPPGVSIATETPEQAPAPECTSPKIKWTGCPRTRSCDACFSIEFDDAKGGSDIMCMNKSPDTECIWTGNLIKDSSFVAVTGSNGKCRPFGNDPLEVSLSSDRCSGSWLVDENGVGKRPPCVFCNGATDIAVEPPSERLPPPEIATENPGQAPPPGVSIATETPEQAPPPKCTSPKIKWTGCPRIRSCDACFSIEFDDAIGGSDIMCMNKSPNTECIWTGNLINDSSFVAVTGSDGKCRPFGNDPLEVSLSSDRCSGSWLVDENGVGKRPPCVFCDGATDIAVKPPSERIPPPEIATENPGQAPPPGVSIASETQQDSRITFG